MDFSSDDDEAFADPAGEESALPKKKNKRGKVRFILTGLLL